MLGSEWGQENWRAESARPGVQDQHCSAGPHAGIEGRDHPQVIGVLPTLSWSWGPLCPARQLCSPAHTLTAKSGVGGKGTAHRQGQHEPDAGQAKPDTSRAGSNFQLLQFPGLSVAELQAKET